MKKALFFLLINSFFLISISTQAQNLDALQCDTEEQCAVIADSLLKDARSTYKLLNKRTRVSSGRTYIELVYVEDVESETPPKMKIIFQLKKIGGNAALEIEGTPLYVFNSFHGKYLDIFPTWIKYINPSANLEKVSKSGDKKEFREADARASLLHRYTIKKDQYDNWSIEKTW